MRFKIKFISDEVEGFLREIEINDDASFLDLNQAVLKACDYPEDQMTSFFLCNDEWERGVQVTREDMMAGESEDIYVMEDTRLSEFIEDEGQHLEFVFDPFNDRFFYMTVRAILSGEGQSIFDIVRSKGDAPAQINELLDVETLIAKKSELLEADDAYFADDSSPFNEEDIDLEGFEISDE